MYLNTDELDEFSYSHSHELVGVLDKGQITELKQYLEVNKQLTSPIRFAGRQWWLTSQEIKHLETLQKTFPNNWEEKALDLMQRRKL